MDTKTKVLIVDDSALVRQLLTEILSSSPDIEVVGVAVDPLDARKKIKLLNPDVITLDVAMPKMDGITFLKNLMRLRPMPVVMISTLTEKGSEVTLQALEIGAVDYIEKPKSNLQNDFESYADQIIEKIRIAAVARVREYKGDKHNDIPASHIVSTYGKNKSSGFNHSNKIIALGASTGGVEAIKELLSCFPEDAPAIVITQHIPEGFSRSFTERMNRLSAMTVRVPEDGDVILPGHVYIAPGNRHLLVDKNADGYICRLDNGPAVNRHKPSVDVMFSSVAKNVGSDAIGVILTGMGHDGAQGMLEMYKCGAYTIAQDEESSVVWGMPGSAYHIGAVEKLVSLNRIVAELLSYCNK